MGWRNTQRMRDGWQGGVLGLCECGGAAAASLACTCEVLGYPSWAKGGGVVDATGVPAGNWPYLSHHSGDEDEPWSP